MSIIKEHNASKLIVQDDSQTTFFLNKCETEVYAEGGVVYLSNGGNVYSFDNTNITSPSENTLVEKVNVIRGYLDDCADCIEKVDVESTVGFPEEYFSAFNRLRVTGLPGQRLDVEFIYNKQEELFDEVIGVTGGSVTHNNNSRDLTLLTGGTTIKNNAAMHSYDVPYTPGDGQLIAITGTLNPANIQGGVAQLFLRSNVTGTITEEVYDQGNWCYDNAEEIDWTKSQILEMDFQSLKVGKIRFYLNTKGRVRYLHNITNDNKYIAGYWQLPSLPLTWRVYNDASGNSYTEMAYGDSENAIGLRYKLPQQSSTEMRAICGTVKSEGGLDLMEIPGFNRAIDMGVTTTTVSTTLIPLISVRPKTTYAGVDNRSLVIPTGFSLQADNAIRFVILHDCSLTGASWGDVDATESVMEYDVSASAVTGGHVVYADYLGTTKNTTTDVDNLLGRVLLWNRRGPETGILTLAAVRSGTSNADCLAAMRWREIR